MSLPSPLPSFYSSRDVRGSERGRGEREVITEGAKIVDAGDRSFVNFIDLCRVEFLFFFREIVEKRKVYCLFIYPLLNLWKVYHEWIVIIIYRDSIKEKYLDRINFQSTIRQEKKSKKKNLLRVECTLRAKKVGSGFIIKIVETIFSISIFPPFSLSLSLSLLASERNTVSNKSHTFYSTEP